MAKAALLSLREIPWSGKNTSRTASERRWEINKNNMQFHHSFQHEIGMGEIILHTFQPFICSNSQQKKPMLAWETVVTVKAVTTHCQRLHKPTPQRLHSLSKTPLEDMFMSRHWILHRNSWDQHECPTPQLFQLSLLKKHSSKILNSTSYICQEHI